MSMSNQMSHFLVVLLHKCYIKLENEGVIALSWPQFHSCTVLLQKHLLKTFVGSCQNRCGYTFKLLSGYRKQMCCKWSKQINTQEKKNTACFNLIFFYINCELLEKLFDNKLFFFAWYEVDLTMRSTLITGNTMKINFDMFPCLME